MVLPPRAKGRHTQVQQSETYREQQFGVESPRWGRHRNLQVRCSNCFNMFVTVPSPLPHDTILITRHFAHMFDHFNLQRNAASFLEKWDETKLHWWICRYSHPSWPSLKMETSPSMFQHNNSRGSRVTRLLEHQCSKEAQVEAQASTFTRGLAWIPSTV
jgi:hypothetical protein